MTCKCNHHDPEYVAPPSPTHIPTLGADVPKGQAINLFGVESCPHCASDAVTPQTTRWGDWWYCSDCKHQWPRWDQYSDAHRERVGKAEDVLGVPIDIAIGVPHGSFHLPHSAGSGPISDGTGRTGPFRQGMAADPEFVNDWIQRNGPYLYHGARAFQGEDINDVVKRIQQEGLRPNMRNADNPHPGKPQNDDDWMMYDEYYLHPRPGHVFMTTDPQSVYGPHVFRVDLRKLDSANLNPDDDLLRDHSGTGPEESRIPEIEPPSGEPGEPTLGEKAEALDFGSNPEHTHQSFDYGVIAHRGAIPPDAIEYMDPEHWKKGMGAGNKDLDYWSQWRTGSEDSPYGWDPAEPQSKIAMPMTLPQEQRKWAEISGADMGDWQDDSEVVHTWPDGWTVQQPKNPWAASAIGGMLRNCWQSYDKGGFDYDQSQGKIPHALHDEHGIPRVAFHVNHLRGDEHFVEEPMGRSNQFINDHLYNRLGEFAKTNQIKLRPYEDYVEEYGDFVDPDLGKSASRWAASPPEPDWSLIPPCPKCGGDLGWRDDLNRHLYPEGAWGCYDCQNVFLPGEIAPEAPPQANPKPTGVDGRLDRNAVCMNGHALPAGTETQEMTSFGIPSTKRERVFCPDCAVWYTPDQLQDAEALGPEGLKLLPYQHMPMEPSEHPDPWMDNEPGATTFPKEWTAAHDYLDYDVWCPKGHQLDRLGDFNRTKGTFICKECYNEWAERYHLFDLYKMQPKPWNYSLDQVSHAPQLFTDEHTAGRSQREWETLQERLNEELGPSESEVVHRWPDDWTVQKHNRPEDVKRIGEMMANCWRYPANVERQGVTHYYSLHDPLGRPKLALDAYGEGPEKLGIPLGPFNTYPQNSTKGKGYMNRLIDWAKPQGYDSFSAIDPNGGRPVRWPFGERGWVDERQWRERVGHEPDPADASTLWSQACPKCGGAPIELHRYHGIWLDSPAYWCPKCGEWLRGLEPRGPAGPMTTTGAVSPDEHEALSLLGKVCPSCGNPATPKATMNMNPDWTTFACPECGHSWPEFTSHRFDSEEAFWRYEAEEQGLGEDRWEELRDWERMQEQEQQRYGSKLAAVHCPQGHSVQYDGRGRWWCLSCGRYYKDSEVSGSPPSAKLAALTEENLQWAEGMLAQGNNLSWLAKALGVDRHELTYALGEQQEQQRRWRGAADWTPGPEDQPEPIKPPENVQELMDQLDMVPGAKRINPIPNHEHSYLPGERVVRLYNSISDGSNHPEGLPVNLNAGTVTEPVETPQGRHYKVQWDYDRDWDTFMLKQPGQISPPIPEHELWPEGHENLTKALEGGADPDAPPRTSAYWWEDQPPMKGNMNRPLYDHKPAFMGPCGHIIRNMEGFDWFCPTCGNVYDSDDPRITETERLFGQYGEPHLSAKVADMFGNDDPSGGYQGYSNWDTWNTKLMMDNEQDLHNKYRELVQKGAGPDQIRDHALRDIIAPHNQTAIQDAQEWNEIPQEERVDPHFEELKEKSPGAADLVNTFGLGPNVEDDEPTLIDHDLVNWPEIHREIKDELDENQNYENEVERFKGQGLSPDWLTPGHDDAIQHMREAMYRHHGALPDEEMRPDWDGGYTGNDPRSYFRRTVNIPFDELTQYPGFDLTNHISLDTRNALWSDVNQRQIQKILEEKKKDPKFADWDPAHLQDLAENTWYRHTPLRERDKFYNYDHTDPNVQRIINQDPQWQQTVQNGYEKRLHDHTNDTLHAIHRGQASPRQTQEMQTALTERGYPAETIADFMKQRRQWEPETGRWVDLNPTTYNPNELVPDDQPGDLTMPENWTARVAGTTRKQLLEQATQLPQDKSHVVHQWPDGWSMRELRDLGDMWREGELMSNCWSPHKAMDQDYRPGNFYVPEWEEAANDAGVNLELPYYNDQGEQVRYNPQTGKDEPFDDEDDLDDLNWLDWMHDVDTQRSLPEGKYLSLRDPDNLPHASVVVAGAGSGINRSQGYYAEALGRHNNDLKPEYGERVNDYLTNVDPREYRGWWGNPQQQGRAPGQTPAVSLLARTADRAGWFSPSYRVPEDAAQQIHQWAQTLDWPDDSKLEDPSRYHITAFYSPHGYQNPAHHTWVQSQSGVFFPVQPHSVESFWNPSEGDVKKPVVLRFSSPELEQHATQLMNTAETRGLSPARFPGGYKAHVTLGHAADMDTEHIVPPPINFTAGPLDETHRQYDELRGA
jgi:predicted RNA-binding Zn-ribbon protein involved in translation (DUF1610 family)